MRFSFRHESSSVRLVDEFHFYFLRGRNPSIFLSIRTTRLALPDIQLKEGSLGYATADTRESTAGRCQGGPERFGVILNRTFNDGVMDVEPTRGDDFEQANFEHWFR